MTLYNTLDYISKTFIKEDSCSLDKSFYLPIDWVCLLSQLKTKNTISISIKNENVRVFANTIKFNQYIETSIPIKDIKRPNSGSIYSVIQCVKNSEDVNSATSGIASCFKSAFSDSLNGSEFEKEVYKIIGELHDNVNSHSSAMGFSMAQIIHKEQKFFFGISDNGLGFFKEINRSQLNNEVRNDLEAIQWCLERGNSTKKSSEFDQFLPMDHIGSSPMPGTRNVQRYDGSHHQGFGLAMLKDFAKKYSGELEIASGVGYFRLTEKGEEINSKLSSGISGVSISLLVNLSDLGLKLIKEREKVPIHQSMKVRYTK